MAVSDRKLACHLLDGVAWRVRVGRKNKCVANIKKWPTKPRIKNGILRERTMTTLSDSKPAAVHLVFANAI